MEKLVELLNEYEKIKKYRIRREMWYDPIWIYWYSLWICFWWASKCIIISNEYWFIEWLYNNDKINTVGFVSYFDDVNVENIIKYLATSDNSIQDLISLLK